MTLSDPPLPEDRSKTLPSLMPIMEVIRLRVRLGQPGILFAEHKFDPEDLETLAGDPVLTQLSDYEFSLYSMEPTALAFLKDMFTAFKPTTVIELGSGISTAILSRHMRELHGPDIKPRYVTVDQSADFALQTQEMLERVGASDMVQMIVAETHPVETEGRETSWYHLNAEKFVQALGGRKADLVIIDGPTAGGAHGVVGSRFAALPLLKPYLAHEALFFMDDAFRDPELEIAAAWAGLDYVHVFGHKSVGKGMLVGCYLDEAAG